jgi:hypothetical protein
VRNVPGATGAVAEFSAPGPTPFNLYNTFNNPNGSERDDNGHDTGSVAYVPLTGTAGTATLNGRQLGLDPTMTHEVRVLATSRGKVVGEASGISTITMDGIAAADGGSVADGFGIDAAGTDGFLTSNQVTASGAELGSVETFSQATGATSTVVSSPDIYATLDGGCAGIYANDTGVVDDYNGTADSYRVLNPVTSGAFTGTWDEPPTLGTVLCAADNQASAESAVLSSSQDSLLVTPADFAADTTGTPIDVSPSLASMTAPSVGGFAEDAASGEALLAVTDAANPSPPDTIVDVNLNSGQASTFPGVTDGFASGLAVNPAANEAMDGGYSGFGLYNLATRTGTEIEPGGSTYEHPVAMPGTSDFLVQEAASPDFFGAAPNNNTMSSILVVDSSGDVLDRYEQFNFYNIFLLDAGDYVQASPATSEAFTLGPAGQQLYPFAYQASGR